MVHPDEGLILSSDRVREAHHAGGISQTEQITNSLTGIAQKNGQTLVSAIVANPQAGASGVAYHLTVPPRYLELGDLRRAMNLRRLELIQQQEAVDHGETRCPLFTWTWSDAVEGPLAFYPSSSPSSGARYLFRGPYDPDSVWNLADNAVTFRGEACLLSLLDIGNALRSKSIEDQDSFKFQMSRVLSITRLLEKRWDCSPG